MHTKTLPMYQMRGLRLIEGQEGAGGDTPPAPEGDEPKTLTMTQAEFDRLLGDRLREDRERQERKAAREAEQVGKKAQTLEQQVAELQAALEADRKALHRERIEGTVRVLAASTHDPDLVVREVLAANPDVDPNDRDGWQTATTAYLDARPYLRKGDDAPAAPAVRVTPGAGAPGARPGIRIMTREEMDAVTPQQLHEDADVMRTYLASKEHYANRA